MLIPFLLRAKKDPGRMIRIEKLPITANFE